MHPSVPKRIRIVSPSDDCQTIDIDFHLPSLTVDNKILFDHIEYATYYTIQFSDSLFGFKIISVYFMYFISLSALFLALSTGTIAKQCILDCSNYIALWLTLRFEILRYDWSWTIINNTKKLHQIFHLLSRKIHVSTTMSLSLSRFQYTRLHHRLV